MSSDLHYLTAVDPQHNSIGRFQYLSWGKSTSTVDVTVASGQAWEIGFYQGQIVWSLDRTQPNRLWQEWHTQKLGNISPRKTLVIRHPVQLYRQTILIIYQNLVQVITGKRTLREITAEIDEDLLLLMRSLTRYIQTGIIELIDLPDLKLSQIGAFLPIGKAAQHGPIGETPSILPKLAQSKLVICIDDNPEVCESMRAIVTTTDYRFIAIQDTTQALPRLLENKLDLIFLNLIMPKVNSYKICGQIRRVSTFSQIPIVILIGKDRLLDRVRSKAVGASRFTCKPITKHAIVTSLTKYLTILAKES